MGLALEVLVPPGCLPYTNLLGDAALENGPSIRAAIGLVPSVPIGFDADQLHIRRNLPIEPALMVRHPHGILPRSVLRGGASNDDETNKNEQGMLQHTIPPSDRHSME